jgi:hypothetical protein
MEGGGGRRERCDDGAGGSGSGAMILGKIRAVRRVQSS